jgi:hypothetical protein
VGSIAGSIQQRIAITALTCAVFADVAFTQQEHRYRQLAPVCVKVTARDHISGTALVTLRAEATRIWRRHGIALSWTEPITALCPTVIPLIFDNDELVTLAGGKTDTALARTVFLGRSQSIYVSVARAFTMLSQLRNGIMPIDGAGERDYRGGTLLGRVVAHELGHVLLTTLEHSKSGLMRPVFGLRDVLSDDESALALSSIESNRLAMRFSLEPLNVREPSVLARSDMAR